MSVPVVPSVCTPKSSAYALSVARGDAPLEDVAAACAGLAPATSASKHPQPSAIRIIKTARRPRA